MSALAFELDDLAQPNAQPPPSAFTCDTGTNSPFRLVSSPPDAARRLREAYRKAKADEIRTLRYQSLGRYRTKSEIRRQTIFQEHPDPWVRDYGKQLATCCHTWNHDEDQDGSNPRSFPDRCRKFLCENCRPGLVNRYLDKYLHLLDNADRLRMIVLTAPPPPGTHKQALQKHLDDVDRFLHNKQGRLHISGYLRGTENKINPTTGAPNWHTNIIYDGRFWWQRDLSDYWADISGGGRVVWIKQIHADNDGFARAIRYLVKSPIHSGRPAWSIVQDLQARRGKKLFRVGGAWHGKSPKKLEPPKPKPAPRKRINIFRLENAARSGFKAAINAAYMLSRRRDRIADYLTRRLPDLQPVDYGFLTSAEVYIHARAPPLPAPEASEGERKLSPATWTWIRVRNLYLAQEAQGDYAPAESRNAAVA